MLNTLSTLLAAFDQTLWIPIVGIGGLIIFFAAKRFLGQRRANSIESLARRSGFAYQLRASAEEREVLARHGLFRGDYNHIDNVMELPPAGDLRLTVFDYTYSEKNGRYTDVVTQTVVHVQSPRLHLPGLMLWPESRLAKLGQLFGITDLKLADAPRFSGMFRLRGENEAAIRKIFTAALIAYCEQHPGIWIGGSGDSFVVYRGGQLAPVNDLPKRLEEAQALAQLFIAAGDATSAFPV